MSVLVFDPAEAESYGLNEAIILQQVRYWLSKPHHDRRERDWIYNSYEMWREQFPFWSVDTIRRALKSLEAQGLIQSEMREVSRGFTCKFYQLSTGQADSGDPYAESIDPPSILPTRCTHNANTIKVQEITQETTTDISPQVATCGRGVGSTAKAKAKDLKPLAEIEASIPDRWQQSWHRWKDGCLIPSNKSRAMAESRIASVLDHLFWAQREYGLSDAAMSHGLLEATTRDKPNGNYVISCANSYTAPELPPQERYYTGPPPVDTRTPVQIQAEKLGWKIGQPVLVGGVSMGIFDGKEIVPE